MRGILSTLPTVLKEIDGTGAALEPLVFAAWKNCVDGVLARNVVPVSFENNRILAAVPSRTWLRNVADLCPALTAKVNSSLGARIVTAIECRVDAIRVQEYIDQASEPDRPAIGRAEVEKQITPSLLSAAASIADERLREIFVAASAGSLARRERDARV